MMQAEPVCLENDGNACTALAEASMTIERKVIRATRLMDPHRIMLPISQWLQGLQKKHFYRCTHEDRTQQRG